MLWVKFPPVIFLMCSQTGASASVISRFGFFKVESEFKHFGSNMSAEYF